MSTVGGKPRLSVRSDTDGQITIEDRAPRPGSGFGERGSIVRQVATRLGIPAEDDDDAFVVFAQRRPRQPRLTARGVIAGMRSTHQPA